MTDRRAFPLCLVLALTWLAFTGTVRAQQPQLVNGLTVVIDEQTLARTTDVGYSTVIELPIVLTGLEPQGVSAVQFGLDVDPRFTLLSVDFSSDVTISLEVEPGEWAVGFGRCITTFDAPYTVATLQLLSPPSGSLDDLTVRLRELTAYGEGMTLIDCANERRVIDVIDMGGVVINPTGPATAWFGADATTVVEGREYTLGWSTIGATGVALDGAAVASAGVQDRIASNSRSHTLDVGNGTPSTVDIEVIREARVAFFEALVDDNFVPPRTRLSWDVVGAQSVSLDGFGPQPARGGLIAPLDPERVYTLRAVNEYGEVTADAIAEGATEGPPIVVRFESSPTEFGAGDDVALTWSVFRADVVTIDPGVGSVDPVSGGVIVNPIDATTYTLTATSALGTETATLEVTPSAPRIDSFVASSSRILVGESVTLSWATRFADEVRIEPDGVVVAEDGSLELSPTEDTTYRLVATSAFGEAADTLGVVAVVPVISLFEVDPLEAFPGQSVTASWIATEGLSLRIEPDIGPLPITTGSQQFVPSADGIVYTLTGSVSGVDVVSATSGPVAWQPPELALSIVSTDPVLPNVPVSVGVQCAGCDALEVVPVPGAISPPLDGATFSVSVDTTTRFIAEATNAAGATLDTLFVEPQPIAPAVTLEVLPTGGGSWLFPGGSVRVAATVRYASSARVEPGLGEILNGDHVFVVQVDDPTTFEVIAENPFGETRETEDVTPRPPVVTLTGSEFVFPGETFELLLGVAGADSIFLDPIFGQVPAGGRFESTIDSSTTFTARAVNRAGETTSQWRVELSAPLIESFVATSPELALGEATDLTWETLGATEVELRVGDTVLASGLPESGSFEVSPTEDTTYTLRAANSTGEVLRDASVSVLPFRIRSFIALPSTVSPGGTSTLSWVAVGVGELELVGFGIVDPVGSQVVTVEENTTYTLIARVDGIEVDRATAQVNTANVGASVVRWSTGPDAPPGRLLDAVPGVPFQAYIVADDVAGGMLAFELTARLPEAGVFVLNTDVLTPNPLVLSEPDEWIVGTGQCLFAPRIPLIRYDLVSFLGENFVLDIEGTSRPSLPSGEPAYSSCADVIFPLTIGAPQQVIFSPVAASTVELQARRDGGVVALEWKAGGVDCAQQVHVFRTDRRGSTERVAALRGSEACGAWTDFAAPADLDGVRYRVTVETATGSMSSTEVAVSEAPGATRLPQRARLLPNVPNPFNPATEIRFSLARTGPVVVDLFDTAGRHVRHMDLGAQPAGDGGVTWLGTDDAGLPVASGVYLVRMRTDDGIDSRRILLVK